MRAAYDSKGNALMIELVEGRPAQYVEDVHNAECFVGFRDRQPVSVELLDARENVRTLAAAAAQYDLDAEALRAAAVAAMSAPNRSVTVEIGADAFSDC